jgi:unsaturated rhamnogalacturonyl hydrolase
MGRLETATRNGVGRRDLLKAFGGSVGVGSAAVGLGTFVTAALHADTIRLTSTTANDGPNPDRPDVNEGTDWGRAMVDSTLARNPDAAAFGSWTYYRAFYLLGQHRVYQRTRDSRYLQYIKEWVDRHVDDSGTIDKAITVLDDILPGNLLLILHRETGLDKYRLAANRVRQVFDTFPRTSDGGFWHMTTQEGQLWLDSLYVALPFLAHYGQAYGGSTDAYDEAANQLLIYASHLKHASNGLFYHAYDEQGDPSWADPVTHRSPEFWGRSIGWYGMALVDVLDILPPSHPRRPQLITLVEGLVAGLARFQDSATGLWYQVVDKGTLSGNWLETSCSCMYVYIISKAIERGYVPASTYTTAGRRGVRGVLTQVSLDTDRRTNLQNICVGTNVGDLAYYLARPRATNELHGLGAFLAMYEQVLAQNW